VKIRFQADADLSQIILLAAVRREPTLDFQTAAAGGLIGLSDPAVLERARHEGRVLVSHDRRTMPAHFAEFILHDKCPGLIIVPQSLSVSATVNDLLLVWAATDAEEWVNRICVLPL